MNGLSTQQQSGQAGGLEEMLRKMAQMLQGVGFTGSIEQLLRSLTANASRTRGGEEQGGIFGGGGVGGGGTTGGGSGGGRIGIDELPELPG
jgi:hypothetical protein